jgi:chromosomal replication initiator protein
MSFVPVSTAVLNQWVRIMGALEKKVKRQSFETWLKPTRFSHLEGRTLFVRVPSSEFESVGDRFGDHIHEAIDNLGLEIDEVKFQAPPAEPVAARVREDGGFAPQPTHAANVPRSTRPLPPAPASPGPEQSRFDWNSASQLKPSYTFANFVQGSGSQFACSAAHAVAERPARMYNPLFIYGGVGLGKTHLMHAIGHETKRRQPHATLRYVTGEAFTNEMINSVRNQHDGMTGFRDRYRSVDVLLIDDVQFLASKERTQEEFFHTFNTLHENGKQVVLASDRPPKELNGFEDRLRSRFEWGLVVDVQPPDLETKVAILQRKAELESAQLPVDVALFIAGNVRTNVRELEGALVRLMAWCSLHGSEMSLPTAQQCLKQFIDTQVRKITIEAIQRAVAEQFGMRIGELKQKNNSRQIVVPRQIAMYLAKQLTEASLPEIGRQFGGKHHTTVMHSIAKIDEQKRHDKDLARTLGKLEETLR